MKSLLAFMKKEWMEQVRSGRLLILVIIFILLGIMNPAVAKLTPWLLEMMADGKGFHKTVGLLEKHLSA